MGLNNDGLGGVDIEQIALDKTVLVGVQAPNMKPSVKIDVNGKSLPQMEISENGGVQVYPTAGYSYSYTDTSWLSHGGIYSLVAGNKINMSCGSGGFEMTTAGPIKFNTAYNDLFCTHAFNVTTRLFTVAATERTHLMGGRLDIDYDEIYITGNTKFLNNVTVGGSVFINGELYCSHITTQEQKNFTDQAGETQAFINPAQSFLIFNGASLASKQLVQTSVQSASGLEDGPGFIDAVLNIILPIPGLESEPLQLPCKLAFTNGISLLSDATFKNQPSAAELVQLGDKRPPGGGSGLPDVFGPAHSHTFSGPAVNYAKDTSRVYKQAKDMMSSETPSPAKPCIPNGAASWEESQQIIVDAITDSITEWGKKQLELMNPFGSGGAV